MDTTEILTVEEAQAIASLRVTLTALASRLYRQSYDRQSYDRPADAFNYGKTHEAAVAAEEALFNLLNTASPYLDCANATDAIEAGLRGVA